MKGDPRVVVRGKTMVNTRERGSKRVSLVLRVYNECSTCSMITPEITRNHGNRVKFVVSPTDY